MPRASNAEKPYASIVKGRVAELEVSDAVMHRFGHGPPTADVLGGVFEHVYTTIQEEGDSSILRAFEACDLEIDNPFHWADLLRVFCDIHFPPKPSKKLKRTTAFFERLQQDRAHVLEKDPDATQIEQAKHLMEQFSDRYGHYKNVGSLRRVFPKKLRKRSKKTRRNSRQNNRLLP